jgi:hypothetical protein
VGGGRSGAETCCDAWWVAGTACCSCAGCAKAQCMAHRAMCVGRPTTHTQPHSTTRTHTHTHTHTRTHAHSRTRERLLHCEVAHVARQAVAAAPRGLGRAIVPGRCVCVCCVRVCWQRARSHAARRLPPSARSSMAMATRPPKTPTSQPPPPTHTHTIKTTHKRTCAPQRPAARQSARRSPT